MRSLVVAVAFLLIVIAARSATGQSLTPQQQEAVRQALGLPPGSTVTLEHTTTKDGGIVTIEEDASGEGASLRAAGEKIVSDFDADAPGATLNNTGGATGGSTATANSIIGGSSLMRNPLFWIGVLSVLLGVGTLAVRPPMIPVAIPIRATGILIAAGIGFITAAVFPALLLFIVAGVALVLLFPYIQREYVASRERQRADEGAKAEKTLRSVAAGVSDFKRAAKDPTNPIVSPDAWDRLKGFLDSHVEDDEKTIIERVRREDGLA